MKVDIYSICWNEADMLGFFFKHYDPIARRYVIYDDGSTDGSLDILHSHPRVEVRRFPRVVPESYVLSAQWLHDFVWQESRWTADWIILTAIDEHLFHRDLPGYLQACLDSGTTLIPALGFQMISDDFPAADARLCDAVTTGAPFGKMNKLCVFRPDQIRETRFDVGRHSADPQGQVVYPAKDELLNLHFKFLDFDRLTRRHKVLASGLGSMDRDRGFGHRYDFDEDQLREDWDRFQGQAVDIAAPGFDAQAVTSGRRWWRENGIDL